MNSWLNVSCQNGSWNAWVWPWFFPRQNGRLERELCPKDDSSFFFFWWCQQMDELLPWYSIWGYLVFKFQAPLFGRSTSNLELHCKWIFAHRPLAPPGYVVRIRSAAWSVFFESNHQRCLQLDGLRTTNLKVGHLQMSLQSVSLCFFFLLHIFGFDFVLSTYTIVGFSNFRLWVDWRTKNDDRKFRGLWPKTKEKTWYRSQAFQDHPGPDFCPFSKSFGCRFADFFLQLCGSSRAFLWIRCTCGWPVGISPFRLAHPNPQNHAPGKSDGASCGRVCELGTLDLWSKTLWYFHVFSFFLCSPSFVRLQFESPRAPAVTVAGWANVSPSRLWWHRSDEKWYLVVWFESFL